jgi:metallophosphoesterase (TIGR03767 family)
MPKQPRVLIFVALISLFLGTIPSGAQTPPPPGKTTIDRTIVAAGPRDLKFGPGQARVTRSVAWDATKGKGTPLAGFKHISDVHVIDEESPARLEFFDLCGPDLKDAYRPQDSMTTHVGDSMLRQLNTFTSGPVTAAPLDFTISTGDNIDSNQFNELRWFIDVLDGETVDPNSGAATYDGYTKDMTAWSPTTEILELANQPFDAVGSDVPWYAVLGNHDGLIRGVVAFTPEFNGLVVGGTKPFIPIKGYDNCPDEDTSATQAAIAAFIGPDAQAIPADNDRHFMLRDEIVSEYFNTTGLPMGHGLEAAPDDPVSGTRASYYPFDVSPQILGISLDTINYEGGGDGTLSDPQYQWLEEQLIAASSEYYDLNGELVSNPDGTDRLIMLFSHHSSRTLDNPGTDPDFAPYHCFAPIAETCTGEGLKSLLTRFPNVIAWVNGHEHNNALRPYKASKTADPDRAFWEVNTAAHVDWPQQSRLVEVAVKGDSIFIYVTVVDHIAALDPKPGVQDPVEYLASISRVEAYFDACERKGQADCANLGAAKHRNAKLVQKSPFDLTP